MSGHGKWSGQAAREQRRDMTNKDIGNGGSSSFGDPFSYTVNDYYSEKRFNEQFPAYMMNKYGIEIVDAADMNGGNVQSVMQKVDGILSDMPALAGSISRFQFTTVNASDVSTVARLKSGGLKIRVQENSINARFGNIDDRLMGSIVTAAATTMADNGYASDARKSVNKVMDNAMKSLKSSSSQYRDMSKTDIKRKFRYEDPHTDAPEVTPRKATNAQSVIRAMRDVSNNGGRASDLSKAIYDELKRALR